MIQRLRAVRLFLGLAMITMIAMPLSACQDPNDPQTWIKRLRDPNYAGEAVRRLQKMQDKRAVKPLCDLYKDFKSVNILQAIISFKDRSTIPTLIDALEFTPDRYNNATHAANALAEFGAKEAIAPLAKVLERELPLKSRASKAKVSAIAALAKIGDPAAVPALIKVAEGRPERQDFFLNKKAIEALGAFGDKRAVPVLIDSLFISSKIQGSSFPQAQVALIRTGPDAVQPLLESLLGKNQRLNGLARELEFKKGIVPAKISMVLGAMQASAAVPTLAAIVAKSDVTAAGKKAWWVSSACQALGRIGDAAALPPLLGLLQNAKANYMLRVAAAEGLAILGHKKALPALLDAAENAMVEGKYNNIRIAAAVGYSRIVGAEIKTSMSKLKSILTATPDARFKQALERATIAVSCGDNAKCYAKIAADRSKPLVARDKAGWMLSVLHSRDVLPILTKAVKVKQPVLREIYLEAAKRIAKASDKDLLAQLTKLAKRDSKRSIKFLGGDLASLDRIAIAVISRKK